MQAYKPLSSQHAIYLKEEPEKQSKANPFARKSTKSIISRLKTPSSALPPISS